VGTVRQHGSRFDTKGGKEVDRGRKVTWVSRKSQKKFQGLIILGREEVCKTREESQGKKKGWLLVGDTVQGKRPAEKTFFYEKGGQKRFARDGLSQFRRVDWWGEPEPSS